MLKDASWSAQSGFYLQNSGLFDRQADPICSATSPAHAFIGYREYAAAQGIALAPD